MNGVDFWKAIEEFDPHTADPHFCWALVQMEEERYVTIKNGRITPTKKAMEVSPQEILDRPVAVWECNLSQQMLILEAEGKLTINNGVLKLTEPGVRAAKSED